MTSHLYEAYDALQKAREELRLFAERYPDRMDTLIATATDMVVTAADKIDADFYTEHEAESLTERSFVVRLSYRGGELAADDLRRALEDYYTDKVMPTVEGIGVTFTAERTDR